MNSTTSAAPLPELLTAAQAAHMCGVSARTLSRWAQSGTAPPPRKIGLGKQGTSRYVRADLMRWIADGCPRVNGGHGDE